MATTPGRPANLIVTADDWGYCERYNAGIAEAARAGAIDAVSAMVLRPACDPAIAASGLEVGLHLELSDGVGDPRDAPRDQAKAFERIFGRLPAFIDGHHHAHATPAVTAAVEELALELWVPVRSVGEEHRSRLRERGIATADRTIGRLREDEPALPGPLACALKLGNLPAGTTEWIVHPGQSDPESGSSYDRGRGEDLALLLELVAEPVLARARINHREARGGARA